MNIYFYFCIHVLTSCFLLKLVYNREFIDICTCTFSSHFSLNFWHIPIEVIKSFPTLHLKKEDKTKQKEQN